MNTLSRLKTLVKMISPSVKRLAKRFMCHLFTQLLWIKSISQFINFYLQRAKSNPGRVSKRFAQSESKLTDHYRARWSDIGRKKPRGDPRLWRATACSDRLMTSSSLMMRTWLITHVTVVCTPLRIVVFCIFPSMTSQTKNKKLP